jgi:hypothetical protein
VVLPPRVAEVALAHSTAQQQLTLSALALVTQALRVARGRPEVWRDAVAGMGAQLLALQVAAATLADGYLDEVLDAQGADPGAVAAVNPQAFADLTDGGGSWLLNLVYAPNAVATRGLPAQQMLSQFAFVAQSVTAAGIQDVGRSAVQTGMQARRRVRTYVRMLRHPSCGRCAILAGRTYHRLTAFKRHPHCDCIHIPAAESAVSWRTSPKDYFRSLDAAEQDRIFTKSGAEAIRLGADMSQVVNADQGMTTVTAYGQQVQATTTGTTVRGLAGQRLATEGVTRTGRYTSARTPRLMPDEIFRQAEQAGWDAAEVLRQLRRFGYLL